MEKKNIFLCSFIILQTIFTLFWMFIKNFTVVGFFISLLWSTFVMTPLYFIIMSVLNTDYILFRSKYFIYYNSIGLIVYLLVSYQIDYYLIQTIWLTCNFNEFFIINGLIVFLITILILVFIKLMFNKIYSNFHLRINQSNRTKQNYLYQFLIILSMLIFISIGYIIIHKMRT